MYNKKTMKLERHETVAQHSLTLWMADRGGGRPSGRYIDIFDE